MVRKLLTDRSRWSFPTSRHLQFRFQDRLTSDATTDKSGKPARRLLISIFGIPGSGKSTFAELVVARLNNSITNRSAQAEGGPKPEPTVVLVPMDGFHLTRAQLSAMPDPEAAHARRGAEFTFDSEGFYQLVKNIRQAPPSEDGSRFGSEPLAAPSFDHAIKDPVADDIQIPTSARVVVFEGLYLNMNRYPWIDVANLMDYRWLVSVKSEIAIQRVAARHFRAGITPTLQAGLDLAISNDLPNGEEILSNMLDVDEIVYT